MEPISEVFSHAAILFYFFLPQNILLPLLLLEEVLVNIKILVANVNHSVAFLLRYKIPGSCCKERGILFCRII